MNIMKYNEWEDTALTLHLVAQMLGKVKVARMDPQPEWNHIVLHMTPEGFTTGLIPNGPKSFSVSILVHEGKVVTTGVDGRSSSFAFENGTSIQEYYAQFNRMLADVMCQTEIYTVPQEMSITTPFEHIDEKRDYNNQHAVDFFKMCVFAHNAELEFVSPFRGKKMLPSFFWGTFDISSILFSGKPAPFGNGGGIIEKVAFDEQMLEFGFWPGDENVADPSFFLLPYPFLTSDLSGEPIRPDSAIFSNEKKEFFLSLEDVMKAKNPLKAIQEFFQSGYEIITRTEGWQNLEWFGTPLLAKKGKNKA
ncbi:MAG: DUF5996 family protein [Christensenellaceae bacterium]